MARAGRIAWSLSCLEDRGVTNRLLSCSLSRTQTQNLVSGLRKANKKQAGAHGRRQRLKTPVNKLSCAGWLPHDRGSVSGCLVLGTSIGLGRLITALEDSLTIALPPAVSACEMTMRLVWPSCYGSSSR
jgi:hypothetical protein